MPTIKQPYLVAFQKATIYSCLATQDIGEIMIAVLTGDIVNSTQMSNAQYQATLTELKQLIDDIQNTGYAAGEVYRGDAFQIQFSDPVVALKESLLLKIALQSSAVSDKPIHCTLSLAYGNADKIATRPSESSGPVFVASGHGLDNNQSNEFSLVIKNNPINNELGLLTKLINHQLNRLTKSQAQLLYQYIKSDFSEHKHLAKITNTTRQNISNRLNNIGASLVKEYINTVNYRVSESLKH